MADTTRSIKIVIDSTDSSQHVDKLNKHIAELTGKMEELAKAGKVNTAEYKTLEAARKKDYASIEKYRAKTQEVERVLKNLSGVTYKELSAVKNTLYRQLQNETRGTEKYNAILKEYQRTTKEAKKAAAEMNSELGKQNNIWTRLKGASANFAGNMMTFVTVKMAAAVKRFFVDAFNTIKDFEQANANLATILGTSRKEITALTNNAKKLGAETEWTAAKVTELQTELAKLGFTKTEILNATKPILGFATALQVGLGEAAEVTGAALRSFGLDASETERAVSVMTVAANKSALSFQYIKTALSTVAPVAKAFGMTIEDVMALLGTLSDAGFDASAAATATRNIILNLANSSGKLATALGKPVKSLKELVPALIKLRNSGIDLNTTLELTDKRSVAAFNRFLDGAESIDKLRGELNNVEGELDRIREEQLNTTEGSIKLLTSAWEGLILSFSNSTGIFKDVVDWLTQIVTWLNKAKVAADDYGKTQTETSYYKQMIEDSRKDHEDTFTKSFTEHINEGYTSEKVYEIEKAQTTKFLNEIQEDFDNFMMRRQQSINMGINKEGEWSKADTDYYNNLKMKIDSTKVSLEALDDVYKKFKTPDPVKTIPTLAPEGKESAVKAALDQQLRDIDNFYKEKQLIIDLNEKGEWKTEEEHQNLLLQNERVHLDKRIETLKSFKTSYKKLSSEATAKLLEDKISQNKLNDKEDKKTLDSLKKKQTEMLKTIEQKRLDALEVLQQEETDQRVIALRTQEIEVNASQARLDVFNVFAQEIEKEELKNGLNRTKVIEQNGEDILDAEKKSLKDREKLRKTLLKTTLDFEKQYGIKTVQQEQSDELGSLRSLRFKKNAAGKFEEKDSDNEVLEKPAISDEQYQQAKTNLLKQYEDKRFQVRRQYGIDSMKELYNSEMDALKEQYELGYLTTEEYEKAKFQIKLKYAQEYAQKAGEFAGTLADTVKSFEEAETAQVEAEYTERQAALTEQYNQGIISREEYDAQKEQLDYEQKVKELEVQKKYADVNFALQTSQIIASTALAAMQAYASMSGIPVVGSVLGAIAAAAAVVAGAAQIAKAKAERDKVKAMTIEAPGGGGDAAPTPTAARVLKPAGFAGGGYNDEDEEQSGYTGRGERYEVAGVFPNGQPYHRGEYIVATPELKDPAVMQYVRAIESVRRRRTNRNPLPEGFAEGGYNTYSGAPSAPTPADNAVFFEIRDFLRDLKSGVNIKAKASVSLTDLKAAQDLEAKATKIFTKTDKS